MSNGWQFHQMKTWSKDEKKSQILKISTFLNVKHGIECAARLSDDD